MQHLHASLLLAILQNQRDPLVPGLQVHSNNVHKRQGQNNNNVHRHHARNSNNGHRLHVRSNSNNNALRRRARSNKIAQGRPRVSENTDKIFKI